MSILSVIMTVLVIFSLLAGLTFAGCWLVEFVRPERKHQQVQHQAMLAELELQRLTRAAVNQIFDAARRAQSESWREP